MSWSPGGSALGIQVMPHCFSLITDSSISPIVLFFFFFFESVELSFIWDKRRTAAREAASQIALRDFSKVAVGGRSIYKVLVKEEFNTIKHSFYKRFFVSYEDLMSS